MTYETDIIDSDAPRNLCQMLKDLEEDISLRNDQVQFGWLLDRVSNRVYAAVLFLPALLAASPLTLIPGISAIFALITVIIILQMLVRRPRVWLPRKLRNVYFKKSKIAVALRYMERPAHKLDKFFEPRLMFLSEPRVGQKVILLVTLVLAALSAPATLIPFANLLMCIAILILAMGLLTRDGVVIIIGLIITVPPLYMLFEFVSTQLANVAAG